MPRRLIGIVPQPEQKPLGQMTEEELHEWAAEAGRGMHAAMVEAGIVPGTAPDAPDDPGDGLSLPPDLDVSKAKREPFQRHKRHRG